MKSYRPGSMIAAAALAALTPLTACGPNPARVAAETDVARGSVIPCREAPRLFFAPDGQGAVGCSISGAVSLINDATMVTGFGPGRIDGEQMRMITAVRANDGHRFCVAQTSVMDVGEDEPVVATLYSFIDTDMRQQAIIAGRPVAEIPAIEDPSQLPADLSCAAGIKDRTQLMLSRIVRTLSERQATPDSSI